jgi:hypothetical protein
MSHDDDAEESTAREKRDRAVEEVVSAWPPSSGDQVAKVIGLLRSGNR